jgi:hypothetical protein
MLPRPGRLRIIYHPIVSPPSEADPRAAARMLATEVRNAIAAGLPDADQPEAGE